MKGTTAEAICLALQSAGSSHEFMPHYSGPEMGRLTTVAVAAPLRALFAAVGMAGRNLSRELSDALEKSTSRSARLTAEQAMDDFEGDMNRIRVGEFGTHTIIY
jgi:hypothetical protein